MAQAYLAPALLSFDKALSNSHLSLLEKTFLELDLENGYCHLNLQMIDILYFMTNSWKEESYNCTIIVSLTNLISSNHSNKY